MDQVMVMDQDSPTVIMVHLFQRIAYVGQLEEDDLVVDDWKGVHVRQDRYVMPVRASVPEVMDQVMVMDQDSPPVYLDSNHKIVHVLTPMVMVVYRIHVRQVNIVLRSLDSVKYHIVVLILSNHTTVYVRMTGDVLVVGNYLINTCGMIMDV